MRLVYQGRRACAFKRKNGKLCERDVDLEDGVYCWQHRQSPYQPTEPSERRAS